MFMKQLYIPLEDLRLQNPDYYNQLTSMACASQRKHEENEMKKDAISEEEESFDSDESDESPSSEEDDENMDPDFGQKKGSFKKKKRRKESSDSDESPSSEEDDKNMDPDFDRKKEDEVIKQRKEMKKGKAKEAKKTLFGKKEPMSAYELMIQKNRKEKMAFLKSLKINEAKAGLSEIVRSVTKKKRQYVKKVKKPTSPPELRKSSRLTNIVMDLSEDTLYYNALKKNAVQEGNKPQKLIPRKMSFKEALEFEEFYERYKVDVNIQNSEPKAEFTIYDKSILGKMTISESNIAQVTPSNIKTVTWYPSSEQLIIAAGDNRGYLGIRNMESERPYYFKTHLEQITNLQFSPYNHTHLISSSRDGILRCGDMVQHNFSEIYNVPDKTSCTYFDILSPSTYLVALRNGQVAVVDERTRRSHEKRHTCNLYSICTVNIHPVNKNFFVTADKTGSIRLWDLRNLQHTPVADITHHKRRVHSAFFSPLTGNSILAVSSDTISIFDSKKLTSNIKVRVQMKHNNGKNSLPFRATWLPNSEELFMVGSMQYPRRIEVYDKNMLVYSLIMHKNLTAITHTNVFHPTRPALAVSGRRKIKVFI